MLTSTGSCAPVTAGPPAWSGRPAAGCRAPFTLGLVWSAVDCLRSLGVQLAQQQRLRRREPDRAGAVRVGAAEHDHSRELVGAGVGRLSVELVGDLVAGRVGD